MCIQVVSTAVGRANRQSNGSTAVRRASFGVDVHGARISPRIHGFPTEEFSQSNAHPHAHAHSLSHIPVSHTHTHTSVRQGEQPLLTGPSNRMSVDTHLPYRDSHSSFELGAEAALEEAAEVIYHPLQPPLIPPLLPVDTFNYWLHGGVEGKTEIVLR